MVISQELSAKGPLYWLTVTVGNENFTVESPTGKSISVTFEQSINYQNDSFRKLKNTFRMLRILYNKGMLQKLHANQARLQCTASEMKEILNMSTI